MDESQLRQLEAGQLEGPYLKSMGARFTETTADRVVIELDVTREHHQPFGVVHGGVYCTIVESAASTGGAIWAFQNGHGLCMGVSNTTEFLRSVTEGRLRAEATPVQRGRTLQLWQVAITDEQDRIVAHGKVRLYNRPA